MTTRYFEDLVLEETHDGGPQMVPKSEIVEFAEQYDPQAFHVDSEAAEQSMFDGLAASGWHTAAITMRLLVDALLDDLAVLGALGVDDLRWRKPVYGGDELTAIATVTEKEIWDDDKGKVIFEVETSNQDDKTVHERKELVLIARTSG